MYSSVPTRRRRLQMLERVNRSLKPGGYFMCCYNYNENLQIIPRYEFLKRLVATLTAGYRDYEKGARLWNSEFMHIFLSEGEFRAEVEAAGFEMQHRILPKGEGWAWALLRKAAK